MKIAILFGDNDFYNCFCGVLEAFRDAYKKNRNISQDKEQLCKIINEMSYGMYLLYQNPFQYNEEVSSEGSDRTKKYLQITPNDLLIGEEVTEYVNKNEYDDHSNFIFDSDLDYDGSSPIFTI